MFRQIIRIIKDGINSLFDNIEGNKNSKNKIRFIFIGIPLVIAVYFRNENMSNIIDDLLSCLSIFTALIFSVLFIVPDKLSGRINDLQEKEKKEKEEEKNSTHNYLIRYLNFSSIFIKQLSFTIVLCIVLIVLLIIQKIHSSTPIVFINTLLFTILIMYLFSILSSIHILLMDDIDKGLKDIKENVSH